MLFIIHPSPTPIGPPFHLIMFEKHGECDVTASRSSHRPRFLLLFTQRALRCRYGDDDCITQVSPTISIIPSHPQSIWRWCCNATVGPWAMRMDGLLAPPIGSGDVCTILVSLLPSVPLN